MNNFNLISDYIFRLTGEMFFTCWLMHENLFMTYLSVYRTDGDSGAREGLKCKMDQKVKYMISLSKNSVQKQRIPSKHFSGSKKDSPRFPSLCRFLIKSVINNSLKLTPRSLIIVMSTTHVLHYLLKIAAIPKSHVKYCS